MPDIFGREVMDYPQYAYAHEAKVLDGYLENQKAVYGGHGHDFKALGEKFGVRITDFEANAQSAGYVTNNLQAVQAVIEEIMYTDYRLDEFVPILTDIPEGAAAYTYRVMDRTGQGAVHR